MKRIAGATPVNRDQAWAIPEPPKAMAANADLSLEVTAIKPGDSSKQERDLASGGLTS
jgi:hypothetical protein